MDTFSYIFHKPEWDIFLQKYETQIKPQKREEFRKTCDYMFNEIGYGFFLWIQNSKIHTFQLFLNKDKKKPKHINIHSNKTIKNNEASWGFIGCLFFHADHKYTFFEKYAGIYYDMLQTVLSRTQNINTCFFINVFDRPVVYKHKCKSYIDQIEEKCKNNPVIQNTYIPILSGATTPDHYDKLIIYTDTWEIYRQKHFHAKYKNRYYKTGEKIETDWNRKENTIVFRGTNTACHPLKSVRLKVVSFLNRLKEKEKEKEDPLIKIKIDVGIVLSKKNRTWIQKTNNKYQVITDAQLHKRMDYVPRKNQIDQSKCKYILCMDGHVTPWRLCFELSYGSCIILIRSQYTSWFYHELRHKENVYIIDESAPNLKEKIRETLIYFSDPNHEEEARRIGENAKRLYKKIMHMDYMRNYMVSLFRKPEFQNILAEKTKTKTKKKRSLSPKRKTRKHIV